MGDLLPKNPENDSDAIRKKEEQSKLLKDLFKWQQKTFPWRVKRKVEDDDDGGEKKVDAKKKKSKKKKND